MAYGKPRYSMGGNKNRGGYKKKAVVAVFKKPYKRSGAQLIARSFNSVTPWTNTNATKRNYEIKSVDIPSTVYTLALDVASNTQVKLLNGIQEGAGFYNRIGRKVALRSLYMRGTIRLINTGRGTAAPVYIAQSSDDFVRIAIVYDRQPSNAALPNYDQIFKDYAQTNVASSSIISGPNLDNRERFVILRDFSTYLPATDQSATSSVAKPNVSVIDNEKNLIDEFIKLKGMETMFSGSTDPLLVASITTGSLLLVTCGSFAAGGAAGTVPAYEFLAKFRLRYDDV